jgi:hypothetical protein
LFALFYIVLGLYLFSASIVCYSLYSMWINTICTRLTCFGGWVWEGEKHFVNVRKWLVFVFTSANFLVLISHFFCAYFLKEGRI